jgi:hypothetical protein
LLGTGSLYILYNGHPTQSLDKWVENALQDLYLSVRPVVIDTHVAMSRCVRVVLLNQVVSAVVVIIAIVHLILYDNHAVLPPHPDSPLLFP